MSDLVSFNLGNIAGLSGFKCVWSNPNPRDEFVAQTVDLNSPWDDRIYNEFTETTIFFIVYAPNNTTDIIRVKPVVFGESIRNHLASYRYVSIYVVAKKNQFNRPEYFLTANFTDSCYINEITQVVRTRNELAVPLYIYAYEPNL